MNGGYRLGGGLIDRARTLRFSFDGTTMDGFAGDTLASALLANGTRLVGRSFKYHRPRGIFSAGPEEPNALVELRGGARREPNSKATTIELYDGLAAQSQNRWPSLRFDLRAVHQLAAPMLVAGFYYKTFMWPAALWEKLYEPAIRRSAGLGRLSGEPDSDFYEKACAFCDLLVIGGGPAGLSATLAAGRAGARVILADEDFVLGGRLLSETLEVDGMPGAAWARQADIELAALPNVRILRRTTVFGVYDGEYGAIERVADHLPEPAPFMPRQRLWKIVARESLLATGATERPIVFGGNDRPGVMLASAVRSYVNRFAASPGRRVAVFTGSDDGWRTVADLVRAGVRIEAVIDPRQEVAADVRALANDIPVHLGTRVVDGHGGQTLRAVEVIDAGGARKTLRADVLAVSGGWNPNIALATHLGGRAEWSPRLAMVLAGDPPKTMSIAGAAAGNLTLAAALSDGAGCGAAAATRLGFDPGQPPAYRASDEAFAVTPIWHVAGSRNTAFVDLQNDVTDKDIAVSVSEGFRSVEHLKRYTTLGMATDQGKTSNLNGLAIMAELTGQTIARAGTTRARPPQVPVAIGAFAGLNSGMHFKPTRLTPAHDWAIGQGASFVESGQWLRAQWFARPGETDWLQSVAREVMAARTAVAICDVSTLGKIALGGPDVGAFLDRVYINTFSTLAVGKVRYGVMLREDGFVMDDGTTARLAADEYLMSTTTANAAKVMEHLEFCHQVLWPELDVQMVSVTEQWAQFAVTGPRSRSLLQKLFGAAADLSDAAFPYMACGAFPLGGLSTRLFRISFSGERAYEIAVPTGYGDALAHELMAAGEDLGVMPYGTEALSVMRIEKGHVAGNELNGQTVARDLGLGRMMSTRKDFVGRIMAERPALVDPGRPTLVGLRPLDPSARLRSGAHLLTPSQTPGPDNDEGYVTSTAFSPLLGHWIGLGLLARGPERVGERIRVYDPIRSGDSEAEIVPPIFLDPEGRKLRG
jgi:methylglutamate dehydrogenase subunit C